MKEMVFQTKEGKVILQVGQVVKIEGMFFKIESLNDVPNGKQLRAYFDPTQDGSSYVPTAPVKGGSAKEFQVEKEVLGPEINDSFLPDEVQADQDSGPGPKPIQGLSKNEINDGLAEGRYYLDDAGNVFKNPQFQDDPRHTMPPNHTINPASADE